MVGFARRYPVVSFWSGVSLMQIRQLTIHRYRGIETFTWQPSGGINCLVGPGDSFKSTVLAAISLLLAPYPLGPCSEFDYNRRRISDGFEIEAYIGNLDLQSLGTEQRLPHFYGWRNGAAVALPEGMQKRCFVAVCAATKTLS